MSVEIHLGPIAFSVSPPFFAVYWFCWWLELWIDADGIVTFILSQDKGFYPATELLTIQSGKGDFTIELESSQVFSVNEIVSSIRKAST